MCSFTGLLFSVGVVVIPPVKPLMYKLPFSRAVRVAFPIAHTARSTGVLPRTCLYWLAMLSCPKQLSGSVIRSFFAFLIYKYLVFTSIGNHLHQYIKSLIIWVGSYIVNIFIFRIFFFYFTPIQFLLYYLLICFVIFFIEFNVTNRNLY